MDNYEGTKSTRKMTLAWKDKLKAEMSGHLARRSGAMMYVRAGLPIQEVAFLGRWKSNVVLAYAEEALEEVPANQRLMPHTRSATAKDFAGWRAPKTPTTTSSDLGCDLPVLMMPPTGIRLEGGQKNGQPPGSPGAEDKSGISLLEGGVARELWVYSTRDNRSNPTMRLVTIAGWDLPMSSWKTACGWPFAANKAESASCYKVDLTRKKCRKSIGNRKGRDGVNEVEIGRLKAQSFAEAVAAQDRD